MLSIELQNQLLPDRWPGYFDNIMETKNTRYICPAKLSTSVTALAAEETGNMSPRPTLVKIIKLK